MNLEFVYKILDKEEWKEAKKNGVYSGTTKDIEVIIPIKYLIGLPAFLFKSKRVIDKKYAGYNCHLAPFNK